jgi:hypothetical protein
MGSTYCKVCSTCIVSENAFHVLTVTSLSSLKVKVKHGGQYIAENLYKCKCKPINLSIKNAWLKCS